MIWYKHSVQSFFLAWYYYCFTLTIIILYHRNPHQIYIYFRMIDKSCSLTQKRTNIFTLIQYNHILFWYFTFYFPSSKSHRATMCIKRWTTSNFFHSYTLPLLFFFFFSAWCILYIYMLSLREQFQVYLL